MTKTPKELAEEYNADIEHALQVEEYCEKLIGALKPHIDFSSKEIEYLKSSALLHDIGYFVEKKSHHKHSLELIMKSEIDGFSKQELEIIANIARYHRNSFPDVQRHQYFANLDENNQKLVKKLASLLRIADGMDKPHKNLILKIEVKETEESFDFYIKTVGFKPKLDSAKAKSDLFEYVFEKTANFYVL